jgi:hypothetical protein
MSTHFACSSHVRAGAYALLIFRRWFHSVSDKQRWWGVSFFKPSVTHIHETCIYTSGVVIRVCVSGLGRVKA